MSNEYTSVMPDTDGDGINETTGGACAAKTPVSQLQELCSRRGTAPKYDLVQVEGAVHEPTFKYKVTVGEFEATGCGQSKKLAKQSAAKAILDLMEDQNSGKVSAELPTIPDLATYDDDIQGNPVGLLQELCMSRRWSPPTYELSLEEGHPHKRNFTMHCMIEGKYTETGDGKSKKLAKRQAANKMIQRLRDLPLDNDGAFRNIEDNELVEDLSHKYSQVKETNFKALGANNSKQISKFYDTNLLEVNSVAALAEVANEKHFVVTFVEEISKRGLYQCIVQLSTKPVAVCYGCGEDVDSARQEAARGALDYFQLMTRQVVSGDFPN